MGPNEALCQLMGMPKSRKRMINTEAHSGAVCLSINVLPKCMMVTKQHMGCADHQPCNATPIPATGTCPEIEAKALVQIITNVETEQASIVWMNQNAAMGARDIQCQLCELFNSEAQERTSHQVRDLGQQHVIGNDRVGCDVGDRAVHH